MSSIIHLARWKDGSFTFFFGETQRTMLHALDKIGDPSEAEVRLVPAQLLRGLTLDQKDEPGVFEIDCDVERMLWRYCKKQVWPLEDLGS